MENPIIKDVMDFEESFLLDKIQRREYEQREKAIKDYNSHMSERYHTGYGQGKNEGREEGRKEGRKEGIVIGKENAEKEFSALNVKLLKEKRYDDLEKASTDPVYREKLFRELHITR